MTDPTRPTDAELEAGHAKLLALDTILTINQVPTSEETKNKVGVHFDTSAARVLGRIVRVKRAPEDAGRQPTVEEAAALRARFLERYPELAAYYEGVRSKFKEPVWTARQKPKEPTT